MTEARAALARWNDARSGKGAADERSQTTATSVARRPGAGLAPTMALGTGRRRRWRWSCGSCCGRGRSPRRAACASGRLPSGVRPSDLNLLLVTLDTTRADRLGAYGFTAIETPNLDRIAREGVLFEHAVAPAPLTLPAHSSLFTSKLPPAHGVRDNGGFFLDERETTMAERLKSRGFRTGGFVGAYVLDHKWGVAQGFEKYFDNFDLSKYRSVSLSSVERRGQRSRRSRARVARHASARRNSSPGCISTMRTRPTIRPSRTNRAMPIARTPAKSPSSTRRSGACSRGSTPTSCLEKTIVVVIGDHGESLGDHGEGTHGFFVYESVLHVPLLIRAPYDAMRGRTGVGRRAQCRRAADGARSAWASPRASSSRARA